MSVCVRVCAECVEYLAIATLVEQRNLLKEENEWEWGSAGGFGLALAILIFSIYSWVFCLDLVVAFGVWLQDITVYG